MLNCRIIFYEKLLANISQIEKEVFSIIASHESLSIRIIRILFRIFSKLFKTSYASTITLFQFSAVLSCTTRHSLNAFLRITTSLGHKLLAGL